MKISIIFQVILFLIHTSIQEEKTCKVKVLKSYGLRGLELANKKNVLCAKIKDNCCNEYDQMKIHKIWNKNLKTELDLNYDNLAKQIDTIKKSIVDAQGTILLKDIINTVKKNSKPPSSAIVTHLNELEKLFVIKVPAFGSKEEQSKTGEQKTSDKKEGDKKEGDKKESDKKEGDKKEGDKKEDEKKEDKLQKELKKYYQQSKDIRKSYFCQICDWESQKFINVENMSISLNSKFCEDNIKQNIELWHYLYDIIFKQVLVLDEFLYFSTYDRLIKDPKDRAILFNYKLWVSECKANNKAPACQNLCKEFNFNKFTFLFDGKFKLIQEIMKEFNRLKDLITKKDKMSDLMKVREENYNKMEEERKKQEGKKVESFNMIQSVDQDTAKLDSFNLNALSKSVKEIAAKDKKQQKIKLKTFDDETNTLRLFKIEQPPLNISKFTIQFSKEGGIDPKKHSTELDLELSVDQLIKDLFTKKKKGDQEEIVPIDKKVKEVVKNFNIEKIVDFLNDQQLEYKRMARQSLIDKFNMRKKQEEMELEMQRERELNSNWILNISMITFIMFN